MMQGGERHKEVFAFNLNNSELHHFVTSIFNEGEDAFLYCFDAMDGSIYSVLFLLDTEGSTHLCLNVPLHSNGVTLLA
jgi:hypothetical protein